MRHLSLRPTHLAWLPLVCALACHHGPAGATAAASERATDVAPSSISEGNVIAIILAANNTDLSYARLVPARARSSDVKAFAQRMLTDHTFLNTRVNEIALAHGITAEDNAISLDFRDHSAARRDILRDLDGPKFDSTYAANEVEYHTELLAAIDKVLVPASRTPELRTFVVNLKPAVSAHLAHAEQMRAAVAAAK